MSVLRVGGIVAKVRTTILLDEVLDHNLEVLSLQTKVGGKSKGKGKLIEEAIIMLLEKQGYPTDRKFELTLKK